MTAMQDAVAHVNRVVAASGSSFTLGMRILPTERRRAIFAVYAFCREVDDIGDGPGNAEEKAKQLTAWRSEIDRLYSGTARNRTAVALAQHVATFDLPRREFLAVIDGVQMDARNEMVAPTAAQLDQYCRNVAGAVGLLSIRIFGETNPASEEFARTLGHALQLTNILRDVDEDAKIGRLYLPRELLLEHDLDPTQDPQRLTADPRLALVCQSLATVARRSFSEADRLLTRCNRRRLRPALVMFGIYEHLLDELEARGWKPPRRRIHLSRPAKIWAALAQGLFRPQCPPSI